MNKTITILKDMVMNPVPTPETEIITFEEFKGWIKRGDILKRLFRYKTARLSTYGLDVMTKPFLTVLFVRVLASKECYILDEKGNRKEVTLKYLIELLFRVIKDFLRKTTLLRYIDRELDKNFKELFKKKITYNLNLSGSPVYLRTDLWFGVRSGGSVGHIAGVLNNLDHFTGAAPVFLSSDKIPTVREDLESHIINPDDAFWDYWELPSFFYNFTFEKKALYHLSDRKLSFIYQRYSTNNYAGVKLAKQYGIPFILEYNGSEIWINRNWGSPLKYESISERIELLNLQAAELVVVVSKPMKDELISRGIEAAKILVNPNGVDPEKYSLDIDGSIVRCQNELEGKVVLGFIGTFGKWHGAEVLAEAYGMLLQQFPEYKQRTRLLLIGDGVTMPLVKEKLVKQNVMDSCVITGLIPQEEGPKYLAACDILVSPHVPNPDGTPFFGSPTKLFEYMAMGKGIVASNLDQIGEILIHNQTAWMVKPGDIKSLMYGLKELIDNEQLRDRLGLAAREEALINYTWREHTQKIIDKLKARIQ